MFDEIEELDKKEVEEKHHIIDRISSTKNKYEVKWEQKHQEDDIDEEYSEFDKSVKEEI